MNREHLTKAFEQYVSAYNADDPKIRLKIDHSYRVAELAERIAETVGCAETVGGAKAVKGAETVECAETAHDADPDFAWTMGLLHDVGRFEQVKRFGTFVDAESIDHAQLGADLLFREGLLEQLAGEAMDEEQRHLLEIAIRNHSAYRISEGLSEKEQAYCNILRDADKIDIFRVLWDIPPEEIYDVSLEEIRAAAVSDEVKDCFLAHTAVLRSKRRTPIDKIVGHICLTFELVYPVSRQIAREQGYVDRLLAFPSENEDTARWFAYMREHIWEDDEENIGSAAMTYQRIAGSVKP